MSKKLNTDMITDELEGSAFFRRPPSLLAQSTPQVKPVLKQNPRSGTTGTTSTVGTGSGKGTKGTPGTTRRKIIHRHPYDIYEDQREAIKRLAAWDLMGGGDGSQSRLVREALDMFIKEHTPKER